MPNNRNFKTTNGLMSYLRSCGIVINGSHQKRLLINYGYYHGYKGYRFFHDPKRRIPFADFKHLVDIIEYDNSLKELFYSKLMFIETALKNLSIEYILIDAGTNEINQIFIRSMPGRRAAPAGANAETKKKLEIKKQKCIHKFRGTLLNDYSYSNKIVSNFYDKIAYNDVPVWAVFEVITLGQFGNFVSNLNIGLRDRISRNLRLDLSGDTNRTLLSDMIFVIQDLRNAVAHNDIIFDTRFRKTDIRAPLKICMTHEIGLPYANFKSLVDYVSLIAYLMKKLLVSKRKILSFISGFEDEIISLQSRLPVNLFNMVVHPDTLNKIGTLKTFIRT
ncbi:Abi family protein [Phosphitispora fastidiosa]|uniref:Abi family protein n=1 Tax=Phosphitispora fastidiosa TaxID=2837202 RepID=UPI001E5EAD0B|nr:Abi family protein [Phosphitispora fastidiosa]MBU7007275.1 abortive infection bacteriophage resistance protein [Phosphitispora fastidiosa]